jgi:predicted transcriptional regulator
LSLSFGQLRVGDKVSEWTFPDSDEKLFTMKEWDGMILQINYVDPDESEMNEHVNDAIKVALDVDKTIDRDSFKGIGIADCASSWKPDFAIQLIGGAKAKKFDTTVLFDYDAKLRNSWNLKEDSYNIIILDKNRICRGLYKGRVPDSEIDDIIQLIIDIQNK